MSNSSSPASSVSDSPFTSQFELSRMLTQPGIARDISNAFSDSPTATIICRHYSFISSNIDQLRADLERHRIERDDMYRIMMGSPLVRERLLPLLLDYRRQRQRMSTVDSERVPSPFLASSFPASARSHESDSPRTVPIVSLESFETPDQSPPSTFIDNNHSPSNSDSSPTSYLTAEEGSATNPIDVDQLPPRPPTPFRMATLHHNRSMPEPLHCTNCFRTGHNANTCIWTGAVVCRYCRRVGHTQERCEDYIRDTERYNPRYQFCAVCNQTGHTLDRCLALQYPQ
jgi:hypothetical protein